MGSRGRREQGPISLLVEPAPISHRRAGAVLGGTEIAALLEKSRRRATTALGFGRHAEQHAHAGAPSAVATTALGAPAGCSSPPCRGVSARTSGRSVASNSVGDRYASAECRRWRL